MIIWCDASQLSNYCWTWGHMLWFQCTSVTSSVFAIRWLLSWSVLDIRSSTDDVSQSSGCSQQHLSSKCQQHMHWCYVHLSIALDRESGCVTPMIVLVSSYHAASISASSAQLGIDWFDWSTLPASWVGTYQSGTYLNRRRSKDQIPKNLESNRRPTVV